MSRHIARAPLRAAMLAALLAAGAAGAAPSERAGAAAPGHCQSLRKHGKETEARRCFESLLHESSPYLRAEGHWGLKQYDEANREFRLAVSQTDASALYRVRWGRLLHERFNDTDAQDLFKEALSKDPRSAGAYLGLALVSADGFDSHAVEWVNKALQLDPRLVEAHELAASLALEDSEPGAAATHADAALALAADALDAMAIHAGIELLADRAPDAWLERMRAVNASYGEGYALIAHHLVLNRRYRDGIDYYRKAVMAEPDLWSARAELGINLMRLGEDEEARRQLEQCYQAGYRNSETVNSLRLLDSLKNFVTIKEAHGTLRLHKKEADLLRPYFGEVLERSIVAYEQKYKMKLPGPVQVEVYPDHEDFAVRTLGMPGLGALGVTFGDLVAMDSPSARRPGDFHWASTLRHELSHVFILRATNHRVPRWFTEGLAVHEETQASPEWGDPMTPDIVAALRDRKLLPIAELDRGFVRPEYPAQVSVSYFEAGRVCDYIQEHYGAQKLLDLVHSFAGIKTTPEAVQETLEISSVELDAQFQQWLYASVGKTVEAFDAWRKGLKSLVELTRAKRYDEVRKAAPALIADYPDYVYEANAYEQLAEARLAGDDQRGAAAVLEDYMKRGGRRPETLKQLAKIEEGLGDPAAAAATLDRINYIDPVADEELHRHLGDLWLRQRNYAGAIREYGAVVASNPLDKASAHYSLAEAYVAAGRRDEALDAVLAALEAAPDYRPAQKLLLELKHE